MNETKPKRIGALGEARAENARLKRELEAARNVADAAEVVLDILWGEGWVKLDDRTLMHGRCGLLRELSKALSKYYKFAEPLSPEKQAVINDRGLMQ